MRSEIIPTKVLFSRVYSSLVLLFKPYYGNNNVYLDDLSKSKNINTKKVRVVIQQDKTTTIEVSVLQGMSLELEG